MSKPVILTGLRANSELHIGNYLGGILPIVELQSRHAGEYQINMFVPDLHSFTTPIDHSKLYAQTIDNLRVFIAADLDIHNEDTFIYRQSYIPAHSELAWILDCFTNVGSLKRMTQFKDKTNTLSLEDDEDALIEQIKAVVAAQTEITNQLTAIDFDSVGTTELDDVIKKSRSLTVDAMLKANDFIGHVSTLFDIHAEMNRKTGEAGVGLLNYPVLMAADILLYGAKYIPLGDDQKQHLELTRDLAIKLNNKFNQELFTVPEPWDKQIEFAGREKGVRIRSLRNPEKKMSKSVEDPSGTIMLSDTPADAAKKVMRAETDNVGVINYDFATQPGVSNLLQMLALLTSTPQSEINKEWIGKTSYGDLKKAVATAVESFLSVFQSKLKLTDEIIVTEQLIRNEKQMNTRANETLLKVQRAVGLRP